jgi:DNA-binding response OmpR family regulator
MIILAVDDSPVTAIGLLEELNALGHQSIIVNDGHKAITRFLDESPAVCILDWMMPGIDGLEVTRRIRSLPGGQDTYIIMLSSKCDDESITCAYNVGVDDFLRKPLAPGELAARLRVAMRIGSLQIGLKDRCQEVATLRSQLTRAAA